MSQPGAEQGQPVQTNGPVTNIPVAAVPVQQVAATQQLVQPQEGDSEPETFPRDYVEQLRRENAAARAANKSLQKKAEDAARAGMSEAEQALAKVREETTAEVTRTFGRRLATSEFRTQAVSAGISAEQLPALLDDLAVEKFVTDDGEPDVKKIAAKVKTWASLAVPAAPAGRQSFDGGARQTATVTSMDDMIRGAVGIHR